MRKAVIERAASLVIFGGPQALGEKRKLHLLVQHPSGKPSSRAATGPYSQIHPGLGVTLIDDALGGFDVLGMNTIRHLNPIEPRLGAYVHALIGLWDVLLCSSPVGLGALWSARGLWGRS